jgi:hypothetical protein
MRVICTHPNASGNISGVTFVRHESGDMVSEEISTEQGARFLTIDGFHEFVSIAEAAGERQQVDDVILPQEDDSQTVLLKEDDEQESSSEDDDSSEEDDESIETVTRKPVGRGKKKK